MNSVVTFPDRSTWSRLTAKQIENKTKAKIKIMRNYNQIKCCNDQLYEGEVSIVFQLVEAAKRSFWFNRHQSRDNGLTDLTLTLRR